MTPTKASQKGWNRRALAYASAGGAVVIVGALVLFLSRGGDNPDNPAGPVTQNIEDAAAGSTSRPDDAFTLFFVAEDGMSLVTHERELPLTEADDTLTRARVVAEHQLGAAPAPLASPFPAGTELRAIYVTPDGEAFVDLNLDVTREHGGGSLDELFTVYALVNALTTNLPEISTVQILIDGREVDTLAGHIDLRHPLALNMQWVDQPNTNPAK